MVIAYLPPENDGQVSATTVGKDMVRSFKAVNFGLKVGISSGSGAYVMVSRTINDTKGGGEPEDEIQDRPSDSDYFPTTIHLQS